MKVEIKDPMQVGRYACFIDTDVVATVIRTYLPGKGWLTNLREPSHGKIVAWIGPLPDLPKDIFDKPVLEYDL